MKKIYILCIFILQIPQFSKPGQYWASIKQRFQPQQDTRIIDFLYQPTNEGEPISEEEMVQQITDLINLGAKINDTNENEDSALLIAIEFGLFKIADLLLENGANINSYNSFKQSILMKMANLGNFKGVKYLVDKGADINAQDSDGDTALVYAIAGSVIETVKLPQSSTQPIYKDQLTPEELQSKKITRDPYKEYLNKLNREKSIQNSRAALLNKQTKRKYWQDMIQLKIIKYLVEHGANINLKSNNKKTPLDYCINNKFFQAAEYLKSQGAITGPSRTITWIDTIKLFNPKISEFLSIDDI